MVIYMYFLKFVDKNELRTLELGGYKFVSGQITIINNLEIYRILSERPDMIKVTKKQYIGSAPQGLQRQ